MITVVRPGMYSTVQDAGRRGHQLEGVPESGAMDPFAARVANLLAGNDDGAALLELTLTGPTLRFDSPRAVVIGGDFAASIDGRAVPPWTAVPVGGGELLEIGAARTGCRGWLAIAGGIDVPRVLGSRATLVSAQLGGLNGRALRAGDGIPLGSASARGTRALPPGLAPAPRAGAPVRIIAGEHFDLLVPESRTTLFTESFRVDPRSDRMGYRLAGPALALTAPIELLSRGVAMGTVQLPPGGAPIVLMADRQTTGGYPQIAHVCSVDLSILAQLRPGDTLRFEPISLDDAQRLYLERERELDALRGAPALTQ